MLGFSPLEMLHDRLSLGLFELAADEALHVEDGLGGVHCALVLRVVIAEALVVGERDIGGPGVVALAVGNDLDTVVLPETDAKVGGARVGIDSF